MRCPESANLMVNAPRWCLARIANLKMFKSLLQLSRLCSTELYVIACRPQAPPGFKWFLVWSSWPTDAGTLTLFVCSVRTSFSVSLWFYFQNDLKSNSFMFSSIFLLWKEMLNEQVQFGCCDIKEQVVGDRGVLPFLILS